MFWLSDKFNTDNFFGAYPSVCGAQSLFVCGASSTSRTCSTWTTYANVVADNVAESDTVNFLYSTNSGRGTV